MTHSGSMKVLVLDVNGVLNRSMFFPASLRHSLRHWIEPTLAERLSEVLRATGAVVVVSSSWRRVVNVEGLQRELLAGGVECRVVGATPSIGGSPRWIEIEYWMEEHGVQLDQVVIVDDRREMGPLERRFVRIDSSRGFDEAAAEEVLRLFGVD
ncbi:MAG: HAD domain-containing protein [Kofleriaceae bacterium]